MFFRKKKEPLKLALSKYIDKELPERFTSSEEAYGYLKHSMNAKQIESIIKQSFEDFCDYKGYNQNVRSLAEYDPEDEMGVPLNFTKIPEKDIKEYQQVISVMFGIEGVYSIRMQASDSLRMIAYNIDKYLNPFELNYKK